MNHGEKWLPIPLEYVHITKDRDQFEKYVDAYLIRSHPGWVAVEYKRRRVLAKWEG